MKNISQLYYDYIWNGKIDEDEDLADVCDTYEKYEEILKNLLNKK